MSNACGTIAAGPRLSTALLGVIDRLLTMSGRDAHSIVTSVSKLDSAGLTSGIALPFCQTSPGQCAHPQSSMT